MWMTRFVGQPLPSVAERLMGMDRVVPAFTRCVAAAIANPIAVVTSIAAVTAAGVTVTATAIAESSRLAAM
jgi:hypothetical protein